VHLLSAERRSHPRGQRISHAPPAPAKSPRHHHHHHHQSSARSCLHLLRRQHPNHWSLQHPLSSITIYTHTEFSFSHLLFWSYSTMGWAPKRQPLWKIWACFLSGLLICVPWDRFLRQTSTSVSTICDAEVNITSAYDILSILILYLYTHTHTHTSLAALFQGLPGWAGTRKVKPVWI